MNQKAKSKHKSPLRTFAWLCAWIPLTSGTLIFVAYLITLSEAFVWLGAATIILGTIFAFIGICALALDHDDARTRGASEPNADRNRNRCLSVILANFPIALLMAYFGYLLYDSYPVTVHNHTASTMTDLRLAQLGGTTNHARLAPGESEEFRLFRPGSGSLDFLAELDGQPIQVEVDGYVTSSGPHDRRHVHVHGPTDITVEGGWEDWSSD